MLFNIETVGILKILLVPTKFVFMYFKKEMIFASLYVLPWINWIFVCVKKFTLLREAVPGHIQASWGEQSIGVQVPYPYIDERLLSCKNRLCAPDRLSCSGNHLLHCVSDRFPESKPVLLLYGYNNLTSGVSGSYNTHLDRYEVAEGANADQTIHGTAQ